MSLLHIHWTRRLRRSGMFTFRTCRCGAEAVERLGDSRWSSGWGSPVTITQALRDYGSGRLP